MPPTRRLLPKTRAAIGSLFKRLDYPALGRIYCDEGGDAFWKAKKGPCRTLGIKLAEALRGRLHLGGRSLYVGAGVAELPMLAMETMELGRTVTACNLREDEVAVLNRACNDMPFRFIHQDASDVDGVFDHVWIVSVLNDPERFPELSALSYGRANPVLFDVEAFTKEREAVVALAANCLHKLQRPSLVTTSTEEINWITDWCLRRNISCVVEPKSYPTATVEDPVCLIRIGEPKKTRG
ncbi:MAG TPA: hypothetical protein VES96_03710 [Nitrospiraceae bacterium]|nr:hypothetical protein [Nitrospiraceae bacterium]